jgi:hypothetical protein
MLKYLQCRPCLTRIRSVATRLLQSRLCLVRPCPHTTAITVKVILRMLLTSMCLRRRGPCRCRLYQTTSKCLRRSLSKTTAQAHLSRLRSCRCNNQDSACRCQCHHSSSSSSTTSSSSRCTVRLVRCTGPTRSQCSHSTAVVRHPTLTWVPRLTTSSTMLPDLQGSCRSVPTPQ